jgi:hypothetical protein
VLIIIAKPRLDRAKIEKSRNSHRITVINLVFSRNNQLTVTDPNQQICENLSSTSFVKYKFAKTQQPIVKKPISKSRSQKADRQIA